MSLYNDLTDVLTPYANKIKEVNESLGNMETATAEDVGKALKAKTVTGGKVTEWEFGESGELVELDATLTVPTKAAQAKAVGDELFTFSDETYTNTGNTNISSVYEWGFAVNGEYDILSIAPEFVSGASGTVNVRRYIGNNPTLSANDALTLVETKDMVVGGSVFFRNVKANEFISFIITNNQYFKYCSGLSGVELQLPFGSVQNSTYKRVNNAYMAGEIIKTSISRKIDSKLDKNQGVENVGKALVVDANGNVTYGNFPTIDKTLTIPDKCADAKVTGDRIGAYDDAIYNISTETYTNTGTGTLTAGTTWGFNIEDDYIYSLAIAPMFLNGASGNITVKRWQYNGEWVNGVTPTLIDTKSMEVGSSVTFYNVTSKDFISFDVENTSKMYYLYSAETGEIFAKLGSILNGEYRKTVGAKFGGVFTVIRRSSKVDDLKNTKQDNPLFGKKVTLIGDSLTHHNATALTNWAMYLAEWCGCTIQNLGRSGYGFSSYSEVLANIASDVDIIGVAASINGSTGTIGTPTDTASDNTLLGYANGVFDTLLTNHPNTPIICYVESRGINNNILFAPETEKAKTYIDGIATICEKLGIPFYGDMFYKGSTLKPWIISNQTMYFTHDDPEGEHYGESDGVHPNSLGHKIIAQRLIGYFEENVIR